MSGAYEEEKEDSMVRAKHTAVWERNPELSLWSSPTDGLCTGTIQCGRRETAGPHKTVG